MPEVAQDPPSGVPLPLGPASLTWPASDGFVQIDEESNLSPALTQFFMPHRLQVLVSFLNGGGPPPDSQHTVGGGLVGAAN